MIVIIITPILWLMITVVRMILIYIRIQANPIHMQMRMQMIRIHRGVPGYLSSADGYGYYHLPISEEDFEI